MILAAVSLKVRVIWAIRDLPQKFKGGIFELRSLERTTLKVCVCIFLEHGRSRHPNQRRIIKFIPFFSRPATSIRDPESSRAHVPSEPSSHFKLWNVPFTAANAATGRISYYGSVWIYIFKMMMDPRASMASMVGPYGHIGPMGMPPGAQLQMNGGVQRTMSFSQVPSTYDHVHFGQFKGLGPKSKSYSPDGYDVPI